MKYTVNPGQSFLDSDGSVKDGGKTIELPDDVAAANRDKVTPLPDDQSSATGNLASEE
jgi:hypothetical protein